MNRSTRWAWLVALAAVAGGASVLAFVLSLTGQTEGFYERNFVWLFWLNVGIGGLLVVVIGVALLRLALRQRRGKFGTRLLTKLAGIFTLVGLLPGLVIYTVSYQFVSRSIATWFDVEVATALDAGLALGKGMLQLQIDDTGAKARQAAERLGDERTPVTALTLERLREQLDLRDLALVGANGQILIGAGGSAETLAPQRPSAEALRQARQGRVYSQIDGLDEEPLQGAAGGAGSGARVRALAQVIDTAITLNPGDERFVLAVQPLPRQLAADALAVQRAYSEYQQRALARDALRRMYIGTLTLALVLAVFGAVLLAALLGHQLVRPLLLLADGVRQVAAGDLSSKPVFASRDELGGLTRSFADMTEQLSGAREEVQRGVTQLESARTRLQTILDNLTAGVVVFDRHGRIDTVNPGATRILRLPLSAYRGRRLDEVPELGEFAQRVWQRFELHASQPEAGERDHWQEAFELGPGERDTQTLLVRGATLPDAPADPIAGAPAAPAAPEAAVAAPSARLMVFDDITEVISAQRSAAWGEVARRLAHEIKNPLTPIQLSAERLQHKLQSKLEGTDQALLVRSVATIVNQVQAMKQLVNEFRDYARLPAAQLSPLDLNALVTEVLSLYGEKQERGQLHAELGEALPQIRGDATQLRQVVHNLVQNALDAAGDRDDARVQVATAPVPGERGGLRAVRLSVTDNGPGFADNVLQRAFEPYITTKSKGTGLGLAVVKKIADEHHASVRVVNLQDADAAAPRGARVSLSFSALAGSPAAAAVHAETATKAH